MSHDGSDVQKFVCPICSLAKQSSIICSSCSSGRLEAIRNSMIENEQKNDLMRREINAIFSAVYEGSQLSEVRPSHEPLGIPVPTPAAMQKLKLSIKKLDLKNIRSKQSGIQKTSDSLLRETSALKAKIDRQKLQNTELRSGLENTKNHMVGMANTKLSKLDKELAAIQLKTECYINRQSSSIQLSHFRVIQETWLFSSSTNTPRLRYGRIIQLQNFAAENHQLNTVNTFLEDCIQLQVLLFDLFSIKDSQLHLPYLNYLQKLLPDSRFYESVQSKINTLMRDDNTEETEPEEDASLKEDESLTEHVDKITIKNNVLQVPRSSRTMNLQRRSSVKQTEVSEAASKYSKDETSVKTSLSESKINDSITEPAGGSGKAKRIVIVPHKLLKKPFAKLETNEYLKFVSVVVKILVNFNCLICGVSDFYGRTSGNSTSQMSSNKFSYDFKEIFEEISKLQDLLRAASIEGDSIKKEKMHSSRAYSDSLQSSTTTVDNESPTETTSNSKASLLVAQDGALQKIYNKYLLGRKQPVRQAQDKHSGAGSKMDGIIYGLVSEAKMEERPLSPKPKTHKGLQVHVGKASFNLKDIVSKVHGIISSGGGGGGHRAFSRGAHSQDFEIAMSMMERSKVHLEDWDMVSRMY